MLKNYFTIAWRSLWKNKIFSLINIFGLSIGIAFTLLVGAYVWGELQVNHDLKDADNQYIILSKWKDPNMGFGMTSLAPLPKTLKETYPNIVANYYHWDAVGSNVSKGDKHFRENIQIGDSTLFSMYGFKLLYGNVKKAFNDPFSVIITEAMAIKYFGETDVVGQTVNIESFQGTKHDFTVSGVLNKLFDNSVTTVNGYGSNFFLPASAAVFLGRNMDGWNNTVMVSYVELKKGITPKDLVKPMQHLIKENAPAQISDNLTPCLTPLKTYNRDANNGTIKKMVYTVSFIALFILLMAIINFINICIGRSPIGKNMLPEKFTLKEIHLFYETMIGKKLNPGNFPNKLISLGLLEKLDEKRKIGAHRSPTFYKFNTEVYDKALEEGLVLA